MFCRYQLSIISNAHRSPIQDILILEDTGHLVSCAFDGKIRVWDWGHEEESNGSNEDSSSAVVGSKNGGQTGVEEEGKKKKKKKKKN